MARSYPETEDTSHETTHAIATIGPFALLEFIGKGGMGDIWRARHRETRLEVAIKVITEERARRPKYHALFHREARSIASLDHPGIVKLYDYGRISEETAVRTGGEFVEGSPYLAMEFCEELSLDQAADLDDWSQVRTLLLSVLDGLAHAHARGVIHRDIKPGNILLREASSNWTGVKLADFGLAFLVDPESSIEKRDNATGTPAYMPPEQLQGHWRDVGPWTDLYSVGCLAYELVCGRRPFEGRSIMAIAQGHLNDPVPTPTPQLPVPEGLESWLLRMLTKQPLRRFRTAAQAAWGLQQLGPPGDAELPVGEQATSRPREPLETLFQIPESDDDYLIEGVRPSPTEATVAMEPAAPPMPDKWQTRSERPGDRVMEPTVGLLALRRIPIVDREAIRDTLWRELANVASTRTCKTILLRGPTGNGKRTLARWLAERAHETGIANTLKLSAEKESESAVVSCLTTFFRTDDLEPEDAWERVSRWLAHFGKPDPQLGEQIAELLTQSSPADEGQEWSASVFSRTLANLASRKPVVLICEQLQESTEVAHALAQAMNSTQSGARILCVATLPDDQLADVGAEPGAESGAKSEAVEEFIDDLDPIEIEVGPLEDAHMRQLTSHLLRLSEDISEQVINYAEGNPLFATELVQYWAEMNLLEWTSTGMSLRKTDRQLIPESSIGIWRERARSLFEKMNSREVRAIEVAAVSGISVDSATWNLICRRVGLEQTEQLTEKLFQSRFAEPLEDGWRFNHAMIRHAILEATREAGRFAEHHAVCASVFQETAPDDALAIGLHFYHAGDYEAALDPLLEALERMREYGNFHRGVLHMSTVRNTIDELGLPEDNRQHLQADYLEAFFRMHTSDVDGLEEDLSSAIEVARGTDHTDIEIALELRFMELFQTSGRFEKAVELADRLLERTDISFPNRFQAACSKGKILARTGRPKEALELTNRLQKHPDIDDIRPARRLVLDRIESFALLRLERLEEAVPRLMEVADSHDELGDHAAAAMVRMSGANALMNLERYPEAEALCRQVIDDMRGYSMRHVRNAELHLAFVLFYTDNLVEAEELLLGQLGPIRHQNRTFVEAYLLCGLAGIAAKRHNWPEFERRFQQMVAAIDESNNIDADFARVMRVAADCAMDDGRDELAIQALRLARTQLETLGLTEDVEQLCEILDEIAPSASGSN
ncbi:MAG: protein kinase domain-containing protein [Myxococcota bacterium]